MEDILMQDVNTRWSTSAAADVVEANSCRLRDSTSPKLSRGAFHPMPRVAPATPLTATTTATSASVRVDDAAEVCASSYDYVSGCDAPSQTERSRVSSPLSRLNRSAYESNAESDGAATQLPPIGIAKFSQRAPGLPMQRRKSYSLFASRCGSASRAPSPIQSFLAPVLEVSQRAPLLTAAATARPTTVTAAAATDRESASPRSIGRRLWSGAVASTAEESVSYEPLDDSESTDKSTAATSKIRTPAPPVYAMVLRDTAAPSRMASTLLDASRYSVQSSPATNSVEVGRAATTTTTATAQACLAEFETVADDFSAIATSSFSESSDSEEEAAAAEVVEEKKRDGTQRRVSRAPGVSPSKVATQGPRASGRRDSDSRRGSGGAKATRRLSEQRRDSAHTDDRRRCDESLRSRSTFRGVEAAATGGGRSGALSIPPSLHATDEVRHDERLARITQRRGSSTTGGVSSSSRGGDSACQPRLAKPSRRHSGSTDDTTEPLSRTTEEDMNDSLGSSLVGPSKLKRAEEVPVDQWRLLARTAEKGWRRAVRASTKGGDTKESSRSFRSSRTPPSRDGVARQRVGSQRKSALPERRGKRVGVKQALDAGTSVLDLSDTETQSVTSGAAGHGNTRSTDADCDVWNDFWSSGTSEDSPASDALQLFAFGDALSATGKLLGTSVKLTSPVQTARSRWSSVLPPGPLAERVDMVLMTSQAQMQVQVQTPQPQPQQQYKQPPEPPLLRYSDTRSQEQMGGCETFPSQVVAVCPSHGPLRGEDGRPWPQPDIHDGPVVSSGRSTSVDFTTLTGIRLSDSQEVESPSWHALQVQDAQRTLTESSSGWEQCT